MSASHLVEDLGFQADNVFRPSALTPCTQCTDAASKASRLAFMIRRSFKDLSKSASIPFYKLKYVHTSNMVCQPVRQTSCRYQPFRVNLKVGNWHSSRPLRTETAAAGLLFLRADLITAFTMFTGILDIDPNLFFFLFLGSTLKGALGWRLFR